MASHLVVAMTGASGAYAAQLLLERSPSRWQSTWSARAIVRDHELFAVDLLHGLLRHSQSAHKRETIAFGRRLNALVERAYVFVVWRNFVKSFREQKPDSTSPAVRLGLTRRRWTWDEVLAGRLFPDRVGIESEHRTLYDRRWTTAVLGENAFHRLKFAY